MESIVQLLFGDIRLVVRPPWSEALLVVASCVAGYIVGLEREQKGKPAGLRTVMLICLGATVFTLVSLAPAFGGGEPGRIAAQIVTGVGFLGAGTIIRDRGNIIGLTSAATIWMVAAIGMVIGAGYAGSGIALALATALLLTLLRHTEHRKDRKRQAEAAAETKAE
jgi:putative Mg2+ transporter-C (MgtC) family protein